MKDKNGGTIKLTAFFSVVLFAVLAVRLWQLQMIKGDEYKLLSYENRLRIEKIPAPRGIIYDRNGKALVKNAAYFNISMPPEMARNVDMEEIAAFIEEDKDEIQKKINRHENPLEPIKLKEGLTFKEVAYFEARLSDHPALAIGVEGTRYYPYGEVGAHLVGYLGRLSPKQVRKKAFRNVPRQAFIGQWGIEKMFDSALRGTPGERVIEVDALGRQLRVIKETPPTRGEDVYLSVDINLQMTAAEAFEGRAGAFVAVKPSTGEVLGLLSSPSFDPNLFSRGIQYSDWVRLTTDKRYPMLNRAIQSQYPPGSTFKIITAIAALEEEAVTPDMKVTCFGNLRRGRWSFDCWRRGGHGTLSMRRAIIESCDVYFYTAGELTGIDNIAWYARELGLGRESGIALVEEKKGLIPDKEWKKEVKDKTWYLGETFNASIGQGFVLATPAQLARMVGAVASGGYLHEPKLTRAVDLPATERLLLDEETLEIVKDALLGVVNERKGTGYAARSRAVRVGGKTGTSQVVAKRHNRKEGEETPYRLRDHAWFVAFAPDEEPEIALAVFVEHGGHGGEAAAPIAKKAIEAYMSGLNDPKGSGDAG
jgi:penicillin-binding protein 2